ncbi:hypothetical protein SAMD00020551_4207 [Mesobacillus selenatarsenatis SF-1]|uniref:Uncharacterized protein n=1 Tax=Mesobacillus selenatarsenatis (strain DSM 18680 / JCM 14380 / FERM P-15431 / SF-1) TaxID=1321606 RepID=A0A0A8X7W0_MESS1|nr:hypothetical protein SAMD00020551_4207 [Mesobacillus selenatarsenatis SF-1]
MKPKIGMIFFLKELSKSVPLKNGHPLFISRVSLSTYTIESILRADDSEGKNHQRLESPVIGMMNSG